MAALLSSTSCSASLLATNKSLLPLIATTSNSSPISPRVVGLPSLKASRVVCSCENKSGTSKFLPNLAVVATAASTLTTSLPAVALVDERLSGEGTGLSLGVSSPVFVWIILGVFTLIWSLYFTFSSTLPEGDDESGLSL